MLGRQPYGEGSSRNHIPIVGQERSGSVFASVMKLRRFAMLHLKPTPTGWGLWKNYVSSTGHMIEIKMGSREARTESEERQRADLSGVAHRREHKDDGLART